MQALGNFWNSGTGGKLAIIGAALFALVCVCCAGTLALGSVLLDPTITPIADVPESPTAQIVQPTQAATEAAPTDTPTPTLEPATEAPITAARLPGLEPANITVNLEQRDFTCTDPEQGTLYYTRECTEQTSEQYEYFVIIYGRELFTVDFISSTVIQYLATPLPEITSEFLGYMATMPFDGAEPEAARVWVEATLPTLTGAGDRREATFGGVHYELLPSAGTAVSLDIGDLSE